MKIQKEIDRINPDLIVWTDRECAIALGTTERGLRLRRHGKKASCPPFVKRGASVFYIPEDVKNWLATGHRPAHSFNANWS